jgi:hypothetical protein
MCGNVWERTERQWILGSGWEKDPHVDDVLGGVMNSWRLSCRIEPEGRLPNVGVRVAADAR